LVILHENCDPEAAREKSLPRDSYLVTYMNDNETCYDIVRSANQVEVFDHYHDKAYVVKSIAWTDGTIHPKMYGYTPKDFKKKRK
jgi:hypothetical protein